MSFHIKEHVVPTCYIREYPGATAHDQEEVLHLHVKQYTPVDVAEHAPDAVTIIGATGIGFPKELYEPLWEEIYQRSKAEGFCIRGIWIADMANLGWSSVLNEDKLGNDPSWMDHSRDLLLMVNHFRKEMSRPLVGIGHSCGGCQIVNLSLMHARLFSSLVLLDPVIQLSEYDRVLGTSPPGMLNMVAYRRDVWPSRQAAAKAYAKTPMFASWDARVFHRMMQYGLRELPTALYPADSVSSTSTTPASVSQTPPEIPVTLTSTKHQEVWSLIRPNYNHRDPVTGRITIDRSTHADCDPLAAYIPLYRPEARATFPRLPSLRPSVLFLLGSDTQVKLDELREGIKVTGTGVGGSGGMLAGMVEEFTFPRKGHLFCFEAVGETAEHCAAWLGKESKRWKAEEEKWRKSRAGRTRKDDLMIDEGFRSIVKPPAMPVKKSKAEAPNL